MFSVLAGGGGSVPIGRKKKEKNLRQQFSLLFSYSATSSSFSRLVRGADVPCVTGSLGVMSVPVASMRSASNRRRLGFFRWSEFDDDGEEEEVDANDDNAAAAPARRHSDAEAPDASLAAPERMQERPSRRIGSNTRLSFVCRRRKREKKNGKRERQRFFLVKKFTTVSEKRKHRKKKGEIETKTK